MRLGYRRADGERGSVIVEAALVFPLMIFILFGIIEFGFIFKDTLTLNAMTSAGARTGAVAGNAVNPSTDYQVLSAVRAAATSLNSQIEGVVIFKASGNSDALPLGCGPVGGALPTVGVPGVCNVYSATEFGDIQSTWAEQEAQYPNSFGCTAGSWDAQWCPSSRVVSETGNAGAGPDYVGVYIMARHQTLTGFFPSMTLTDTVIQRIEPQTP